MRITIDNEDGLGPVDYTSALLADGPITIQRALNTLSRCTAEVLLGLNGLATPVRRARISVINQAGVTAFTGYLAVEPVAVYAGAGLLGPMYRARLSAVSDEWLLDKQGSGAGAVTDGLALSLNGGALIAQMTQVVQNAQSSSGEVVDGITVSAGGSLRSIGAFAIDPSAVWSTNAGAVANASYASYRVLDGAVSVLPVGATTHEFSDANGSLNLSELNTSHVRELANDVTLSGTDEPATYVQEILAGDGTTAVFELSQAVFRGTNRTLLRDNFAGPMFDSSQWVDTDPNSCLQLTSAGLTFSGGTGVDGQTILAGVNSIEMGGFLLATLGGVVFGEGSNGMLTGFYNSGLQLAGCFAGFRVRQSVSTVGGVTVVVPVVNGAEIGTTFAPISGHRYTLRLRIFCVEMQRILQTYTCLVDGQVASFGPTTNADAPMQVVFDLLDEGASSNTPATVLYDTVAAGTTIMSGPAISTFVAVNATDLYGSIASVKLTRTGSAWISSLSPSGAQFTRLLGTAGEGVDCDLTFGSVTGSPGKITFFSGRVPVAGERITVFYRTQQRAVARLADAASIAVEVASGVGTQVPGVSRWLGKVEAPVARSSEDCEFAAQAVLAMAASRSAALSGTYTVVNPAQDIWPGDVLAVRTAGQTNSFLVRSVVAKDNHAVPESVEYKVCFANDWASEWADGFGLKLADKIAEDAWLPAAASSGPALVCASLQQTVAVSLTNSAIQVDAGLEPPPGGGFEVRRRDWSFGPRGDIADLVLRSSVRSFSLPRSAQVESFYVRMYDGSTPPMYSRFSTLLRVNWPLY